MENKDFFYPHGVLRTRINGTIQNTYWPSGSLKRTYDSATGLDQMYNWQGKKIALEKHQTDKPCYFEGPFLVSETIYQKDLVCKNHALLAEKCPAVQLLAALDTYPLVTSEQKNITRRLAQKLKNKTIKGFIFYGLGSGIEGTFLLPFLEKNPEHFIVYIMQSEQNLANFLATNHATSLVQHPQVHFIADFFGTIGENTLWHELEKLMLDQVEIEILANENATKRKKVEMLFSQISLRAAVEQEVLHAEKIACNVLKNFKQLKFAFSAQDLHGSAKGHTVIVCGAGPSLDPLVPLFKQHREKIILLAGGSAITALVKKGITPDLCIAFDPNYEELDRLAQVSILEIPLLIGARLYPDVLATHSGPLGYIRSGTGGLLESYLEEKLGIDGPSVHEILPDESLSVTMIAAALAKQMEAERILFAGVDLAYLQNKRYSSGVSYSEQAIAQDHSLDKLYRRKNSQGEFVITKKRWLMEAKALKEFAKSHTCYNLSKTGLKMPGIATRDFTDFIPELQITHFHKKVQAARPMQQSLQAFDQVEKELLESLERCSALFKEALKKAYGSLTDYMIESELENEIADQLFFAPARILLRKKKHLGSFSVWDFHLQGAEFLLKELSLEKAFVAMELVAQGSNANS